MVGEPGNQGGDPGHLELRDWFAGQALIGLITAQRNMSFEVAEEAYKLANEMIEARRESEP